MYLKVTTQVPKSFSPFYFSHLKNENAMKRRFWESIDTNYTDAWPYYLARILRGFRRAVTAAADSQQTDTKVTEIASNQLSVCRSHILLRVSFVVTRWRYTVCQRLCCMSSTNRFVVVNSQFESRKGLHSDKIIGKKLFEVFGTRKRHRQTEIGRLLIQISANNDLNPEYY